MRTVLILAAMGAAIATMTAIGVGVVLSLSSGAARVPLVSAMVVHAAAMVVIAWKLRAGPSASAHSPGLGARARRQKGSLPRT